jgi:Kef-type K+ transport system membrane component KefB/nucleotide-binding universal stress UspA family protein
VQQEPIISFAILLAVILIVPLIFERLRVPGLVGLLVAGVVLGPNGLQVFQEESETMRLLSDIGLIYLMFVAGLEIDLEQFNQTRDRSIGFGFFTFIVPMITGTLVGRCFGFGWNASVLIGSLFASHTLLAYPIISRLGVIGNEAVTVTIGATIFTDVGALLVLAVCVAIHAGELTVWSLATLFGSLAIYTVVVLFGFIWAGKQFFRHSRQDEGNQFLFVLLALFLAAIGAQLIGVEKIVGAFLSGLAVNRVVGDGPVKEKIIFVGSVLFIPIFFVDMGLLIRIPAFVQSLTTPQLLGLTITIVVGLIGSKFGAAFLAKLAYRYSWQETLTMWSLSLPQVAATLAATLVGYRAGLLTEGVLNGVIVLMLVTATLGPILTARFADGLRTAPPVLDREESSVAEVAIAQASLTIVPIYNPRTEQNLLEMAGLIARETAGQIAPLAIALDREEFIEQHLERCFIRLRSAMEYCQELKIPAQPILRIDDKIAQGICRASREQNASLILMGWRQRSNLRSRLFGDVISNVLWGAHCPVAIARLLASPSQLRRILVPIENLTEQSIDTLRFAQTIADSNRGQITILHVCDRGTSPSKQAWIESQLTLLTQRISSRIPEIQVREGDVVAEILSAAQISDLVVLRTSQRPLSAGGLPMSGDITSQIATQVACSMVMFGEPIQLERAKFVIPPIKSV